MPQANILRCARWIFKDFWKWHVDNIGLMAESLLAGGGGGPWRLSGANSE